MGSTQIDALDVMVFDEESQKNEYENAVNMVQDDMGESLTDGEIIEIISRAYTGRL